MGLAATHRSEARTNLRGLELLSARSAFGGAIGDHVSDLGDLLEGLPPAPIPGDPAELAYPPRSNQLAKGAQTQRAENSIRRVTYPEIRHGHHALRLQHLCNRAHHLERMKRLGHE